MKTIQQGDHKVILLDMDDVQKLCKLGEGADTCIWLVMGGKGFECLYYQRQGGINLLGETLEDRWKRGLTIAKRDGCEEARKLLFDVTRQYS